MLETSEERVKLLRAGISGKTIEKLYLKKNNFKILIFPLIFDLLEIDVQGNDSLSSSLMASDFVYD